MARNAKSKKKRSPKTVLKLPDLEQSKSAVVNSLSSPSSQRSYDHAIREFIDWYCSEPRLAFNKTVVTRYRISLEQRQYAPSTINLRLAAVRRLAYEASDCGLLSPDLSAGIRRVKGARRLGVRIGNWLAVEEGRRLIDSFGTLTPKQRRNRAMIAVLIGCGLRRAALAAITSGPLFRAINKAGRVWGNGFTPKVIWSIVKAGAVGCGLQGSPRMTCAGHVPDCAIRLAVSSNRSSFSSDTFQSKPQNGIWAVSSVFKML